VSHALAAHLAQGLTTVCRCWLIRRHDGMTLGFTDHDAPLRFEGVTFRPQAGLSAGSLMQGTGLAVDNAEAVGVLSDDAISTQDLEAGRYDRAEVTVWLVNWNDLAQRRVVFAGTLGEVRRGDGAFRVELRGLTEGLNRAAGQAYVRHCSAVLGDRRCGFDLGQPGYRAEWRPVRAERGERFFFEQRAGFQPRWFERGRLFVLSGSGAGLEGVIKHDKTDKAGRRIIELWEPIRAVVETGDLIRLEAGCDKRAETCRSKFANLRNYRGFPSVPGEDWLVAIPAARADVEAG
jgi:uncharacterized phage protein (TIGR02218 family)